MLLLASFISRFPAKDSSSGKKSAKTKIKKEARMKAIKGSLKRGWESVRSVTGDIAGGVIGSYVFPYLTGAVAPG